MRYFNAADAPVADTGNLLGIGGDDQVDVPGTCGDNSQMPPQCIGVVDGEIDAAWTPALVVIMLHRHTDSKVADDRDHFAKVLGKEAVKQHLVAIVQSGEIDVLTQRIGSRSY